MRTHLLGGCLFLRAVQQKPWHGQRLFICQQFARLTHCVLILGGCERSASRSAFVQGASARMPGERGWWWPERRKQREAGAHSPTWGAGTAPACPLAARDGGRSRRQVSVQLSRLLPVPRAVAMDICWWEGTSGASWESCLGWGMKCGMLMGAGGSSRDVPSGREAILEWDEAIPKSVHPPFPPTALMGWLSGCEFWDELARPKTSEGYFWTIPLSLCVCECMQNLSWKPLALISSCKAGAELALSIKLALQDCVCMRVCMCSYDV